MTLQQLKNEIEERFEKKFRNPANLKEGIFWGWSSQDMNGYEQIKSFLLSEIEKAYQAGREEALEEVERDVENSKKMIGVDIQDISPTGLSYNNALSGILNIIQKLKVNK